MTDDSFAACEEALGYQFKNRSILKVALIHSSDKTTQNLTPQDMENLADHSLSADNERLEFLGDAILGFVTCDHLYRTCPDHPEGKLTHIKSNVVSRRTLAKVAHHMGLKKFLIVGKGMDKDKNLPGSVLANLFEAILAAIYLDGGIDAARTFILDNLVSEVESVEKKTHIKNYKSLLQQYAQKLTGQTPTYRVLEELGPDHSKEFIVSATINKIEYPHGTGPSKKIAQQHAAQLALDRILADNSFEAEHIDIIDS